MPEPRERKLAAASLAPSFTVRGGKLMARRGSACSPQPGHLCPPHRALQVQPSPGRRPAEAPGACHHPTFHRLQEPGPWGLAARRGRVAGQLSVRREPWGPGQGGADVSPHGGEENRAGRNRHVGFGLLVPREAAVQVPPTPAGQQRPLSPPKNSVRRCSGSPSSLRVRLSQPQSPSVRKGRRDAATRSGPLLCPASWLRLSPGFPKTQMITSIWGTVSRGCV